MENRDIKILLEASGKRAVVGDINPFIRAISAKFDGESLLVIKAYLGRVPNEEDYETLSDITAEILSDLEFERVIEECEFSLRPLQDLDIDIMLYAKKE
jgi:hypothetical protein